MSAIDILRSGNVGRTSCWIGVWIARGVFTTNAPAVCSDLLPFFGSLAHFEAMFKGLNEPGNFKPGVGTGTLGWGSNLASQFFFGWPMCDDGSQFLCSPLIIAIRPIPCTLSQGWHQTAHPPDLGPRYTVALSRRHIFLFPTPRLPGGPRWASGLVSLIRRSR